MKKTTAIITAILIMSGGDLLASGYRTDQVIVKFKPTSALAAAFVEDTDRCVVLAVADADEAIAELQDSDDVEYVEPDYIIEAEEIPSDWGYPGAQWADVSLPQAWDLTGADQAVVVAVVDSGCDLDHSELVDALVAGWDFANNDATPDDEAGHGTKVSGIIAAKGNNGNVAGVAWDIDIRIMPLRFMDENGSGSVSAAIEAIRYAVDHGADIINASWGFGSYSASLESAIQYARDHGVLFVCSAGNSGDDNDVTPHYPSNYTLDNLIAVAAIDDSDNNSLACFSNYGYYSVDVAAPGKNLRTTTAGGGMTTVASGTSYAAPFVSAVAALVISENPAIGYQDLRDRIVRTTVLSDQYSRNLYEVGGCVNAYNAIRNLNVHAIPDKDSWVAPAAQSADASTLAMAGGGSSGGGCFIGAAQPGAWIMLLVLIPLFLRSVPRRQE